MLLFIILLCSLFNLPDLSLAISRDGSIYLLDLSKILIEGNYVKYMYILYNILKICMYRVVPGTK